MKQNGIEIVETADTFYIILRHTQMAKHPLDSKNIPKKQQSQCHFCRRLCIPCSKIFRLQYRHTFGVGLEKKSLGATFERLQDTGGLYLPTI